MLPPPHRQMSVDGTHFITASPDRTSKLVDTQVGRQGPVLCPLTLRCRWGTAGAQAVGSLLTACLAPSVGCMHWLHHSSLSCPALPCPPQSFEVLKEYKSAAPINSAAISPIFDHVLIGGGQARSCVRVSGGGGGHVEVRRRVRQPRASPALHAGPLADGGRSCAPTTRRMRRR